MSEDINDKKENENDSNEQPNIQSESETEEQLIEKGRIALIQIETEGKKFFKPQNDVTYRLIFDRAVR